MAKTVGDIMTRDPITANRDTPLIEVIKILAEKRISGLPVVDQDSKLVGVISEADLMWRETGATMPPYIMFLDSVIYLENPAQYEREVHKALGETVGEAMTSEHLVTIAADQPLRNAAQLMHDRKVHRLPVVDASDRVIGILTRGDIIRSMAADQG